VCVIEGQMNTWATRALLIWSTSSSYDHKRDFQVSKSNIVIRISLGLTFSISHNFGPSITHEV
jgi:hypothetical protein